MTDFLKKTIGHRVRLARKAKGLTQEQLSEQAGCTIESISNIERGVSLPTIRTLSRIATLLGVPLRDMFPEDEDGSDVEKRIRLNALFHQLSDSDAEAAIAIISALLESRSR